MYILPKKVNVFLAFLKEDFSIYFRKDIKKYRVRINSFETNSEIHIGYFTDKQEAKNQYIIHKKYSS